MPELPEVETFRRSLLPMVGSKVNFLQLSEKANVLWKETPATNTFQIKDIRRHGKTLFWVLNKGYFVSNLGMSGHWRINNKQQKHDLIALTTLKGTAVYNDPRRFGKFSYQDNDRFLARLGYDPVNEIVLKKYIPWRKYTYILHTLLLKRKKPIKEVLLDQGVLSGIGNIYASEILWECLIHPLQPSNTLTDIDAFNILKYSNMIMLAAIDLKGSTIHSFKTAEGDSGKAQTLHKVYAKDGMKCMNCDSIILKIKQNRSSFYCPQCQTFS